MGERPEALWIVLRAERDMLGKSEMIGQYAAYRVFRSREAARKFAADKRARQKGLGHDYKVSRVTWGPEQ